MDDIAYSLEQIAAAVSGPGYALLGQGRGRWFRPRDLEDLTGLDRSTIRKHYAEPLKVLGLLDRREAANTPRPTFEYAVTEPGEELRRQIDVLLGLPSPAEAGGGALITVSTRDPDVAEGLAAQLQQLLVARRVSTVALEVDVGPVPAEVG